MILSFVRAYEKSVDYTVFFKFSELLTNPQKHRIKNILCFRAIPFIVKKAKPFIISGKVKKIEILSSFQL